MSEKKGVAPESPAVELARFFHETYERLAPKFAYQTRPESATTWEQVPLRNRILMVATAQAVLDGFPLITALQERVEGLAKDVIELAGGMDDEYGGGPVYFLLNPDRTTTEAIVYAQSCLAPDVEQGAPENKSGADPSANQDIATVSTFADKCPRCRTWSRCYCRGEPPTAACRRSFAEDEQGEFFCELLAGHRGEHQIYANSPQLRMSEGPAGG